MGAGCSNLSADDKKAAVQSRAIDKELAQAKKKATKEVKLLLLGAGASGKSTVAKQMHILYLNGFGDQELAEYKQQVATNLVNNMRALLLGARKLGTPSSPPLSPFHPHRRLYTRAFHAWRGAALLACNFRNSPGRFRLPSFHSSRASKSPIQSNSSRGSFLSCFFFD
jgi:energy-coupling factor transporter ATP-binding protein EcfA2